MVDGSNDSLEYPDEELDPNLGKGSPLQKKKKTSLETVDVPCDKLVEKKVGGSQRVTLTQGHIKVAENGEIGHRP